MTAETGQAAASAAGSRGTPAPAAAESRWLVWLGALLLVLAGVLAYRTSFQGVFMLDDAGLVEMAGKGRLWPLTRSFFHDSRWLGLLTFALNYAANGLDPWGYHLVNLVIHLAAGLTLYGVVRRTLLSEHCRGRWGNRATGLAFGAALLWVVHPINTQAVTYVVQRYESLMGLWYLLTLYCALRAFELVSRQSGPVGGVGCWPLRLWYVLAAVCCAAGMVTKQVMLTAPLTVLVYDRIFWAGSFWRALRRNWLLYAGLALSWGVLLLWLSSPTRAVRAAQASDTVRHTMLEYFLTQPTVLLHYLKLMVKPWPQALDYSDWPVPPPGGELVVCLAVVTALFLVTAWGVWRGATWAFPGAWFFLTLAVSSSFIPIADVAFEHRMYLAGGAVTTALVLGGWAVLGRLVWPGGHAGSGMGARWPGVSYGLLVLVAALALGVVCSRRNVDYHSAAGMWEKTVATRPRNARALRGWAEKVSDLGRYQDALALDLRAQALEPDNALVNNNLAKDYLFVKAYPEAEAAARAALKRRPELPHANANLAMALVNQGREKEAMPYYERAKRRLGKSSKLWYNMGLASIKLRDLDGAIKNFSQATALDPSDAEAYGFLGHAWHEKGDYAKACDAYQMAVKINPRHKLAWNGLANCYRQRKMHAEAAEAFRKAAEVSPESPDAHGNLGAALMVLKNYPEAEKQLMEAQRLAPDNPRWGKNLEILRKLMAGPAAAGVVPAPKP